jgi:parallel beta-helix repeat protein
VLPVVVLGLQSVGVVMANFKPPPLPAVHITSDGDISNSSALIRRNGDLYTFTGNWSATSYFLEVDRSNIVIDGVGFFIIGNEYALGINLKGVSNVKISNVNIADRNRGFYLENCSNVTITGCSVTGGNHGIYLNNSKNNVISGNRFSFTYNGIYLDHSGGNVLRDNNIQVTSEPIQEKPTDLQPGQLSFGLDFMVTGETLADYVNDVDASNLVNDKSIIYW